MEIELHDIQKHYGPLRANNGISLAVAPGTVHGILGENGAGKSTLMKILAGYIRKTGGEILLDGKPADYATPAQAARLGIGMLYQDPLDFPRLTVLENFMLGQAGGILQRSTRFRRLFKAICENLNFFLRPDTLVSGLTVGERQQLEIARLLSLGCRTLILDEPTAGISGIQREILFTAVRKLAAEGKSILLVSHKLEDVQALCDRVTVLRQGMVAGQMNRPLDAAGLLKMMFEVPPLAPPFRCAASGPEVLALHGVSADGGRIGLAKCDVVVKRGEIVGLAGLAGSGQGILLRVACGIQAPLAGSIYLQGQRVERKGYHFFKSAGVSYLPASRLEEGLVAGLSVAEHSALLQRRSLLWIQKQAARRNAADRIRKFHIRATPESAVESLSGGNQQRLLLSFLPENPLLLALENPTRGLDVESSRWVWQHLLSLCARGSGIIFSSPELEEIMTVAGRVLIFFDGRIIRDVKTSEIDIDELGRAIAGKA